MAPLLVKRVVTPFPRPPQFSRAAEFAALLGIQSRDQQIDAFLAGNCTQGRSIAQERDDIATVHESVEVDELVCPVESIPEQS
jgi:hypothetical protein